MIPVAPLGLIGISVDFWQGFHCISPPAYNPSPLRGSACRAISYRGAYKNTLLSVHNIVVLKVVYQEQIFHYFQEFPYFCSVEILFRSKLR